MKKYRIVSKKNKHFVKNINLWGIEPTERELSAITRASPEDRSELVDQLREPKRPSRKKAPEIQKIEEISEKC